jgi:hypothetical protein
MGFVPPSMSWELRNRLKKHGWKYRSKVIRPYFVKRATDSDLEVRHYDWWVGVNVTLPKMLADHNSSMDYDHAKSLAMIRSFIDRDIALGDWASPPWEEWFVNRVDVTADFTFEDPTKVRSLLAVLKNARMINRTRHTDAEHGVKWSSVGWRVACSVYDKFSKDQREVDRGKLRFTVSFTDQKQKDHVRRHGIKMVDGLLRDGGRGWLSIVCFELKKIRSKGNIGILALVAGRAAEAYGVALEK